MDLPPEMIRTYVERRGQDFEILQKALIERDHETYKKIGHQLKGNASSFGFDDLASIGTKMDKIQSENFLTEAKQLLEEFRLWLERNRS